MAKSSERSISVLRLVVLAVIVANLLDAVFTMFWVESGIAVEANALMAVVLERSAVGFTALKLAVVSAGVLVLWRLRHRSRLAVPGLVGCCVAYSSLMVYHFGIAALAIEFA